VNCILYKTIYSCQLILSIFRKTFRVLKIFTYMKSSIFWDTTSCSPLKANRRFRRTCCLRLQGRRIDRARTSVKAGGSSEKLVDFERTTRCYFPEDRTLHSHFCGEPLILYITVYTCCPLQTSFAL
jgi:hypothetical protein